jgi:hypothetical protein
MGSFTPLPLYFPGKHPSVPVGNEAGWTSESVWTVWRGENMPAICFHANFMRGLRFDPEDGGDVFL